MSITMSILMHKVDSIYIFYYISTFELFAILFQSEQLFGVCFITNGSSIFFDVLHFAWEKIRIFLIRGHTIIKVSRNKHKKYLFLQNTIIIQYIMFNMLNKTLLHIFDAEVIFNSGWQFNLIQLALVYVSCSGLAVPPMNVTKLDPVCCSSHDSSYFQVNIRSI